MAADRRYKYHHIVDILLAASPDDTPADLARMVRDHYPRGHYDPVRICEDIGRIVRRAGNFAPKNVRLSRAQIAEIRLIRDRFKERNEWLTRTSTRETTKRPRVRA